MDGQIRQFFERLRRTILRRYRRIRTHVIAYTFWYSSVEILLKSNGVLYSKSNSFPSRPFCGSWLMTMNLLKKFTILVVLLSRKDDSVVRVAKFSAVSDIPYADKLYQEFRNEEPPSHSDPATRDARIRRRICEDVTNSGFFEWLALEPVNSDEVHAQLTHRPEYLAIFRQIYRPSTNWFRRFLHRHEYSNPYTKRLIEVREPTTRNLYSTKEHVFVCWLRKRFSDDLVPFYISKEYNIGVGRYQAARFVFGEERFLVLAEISGRAHTKPNFNIELHYLEVRRNHLSQLPTYNPEYDPVLGLISRDPEYNQHFRLCAFVLSSSCFRTKFKYPYRVNAFSIIEDDITFKTSRANALAGEQVYRERLVVCPVREVNTTHQTRVYISRAYKSNQVFVYLRDPSNGKMYLEKLIIDVSIVQEPAAHNPNNVI